MIQYYITNDISTIKSSERKRRRVDEILRELCSSRGKSSGKENQHESEEKKIKMNHSTKVTRHLSKHRSIHVGWLHKLGPDGKYLQMKKPVGGIKEITLRTSQNYLVEDIKDLAIQAFTVNNNCPNLKKLQVKLGFFDGTVITKFQKHDGEACDLWTYCKVNDRKYHFYLLTIETEIVQALAQNEDKFGRAILFNNDSSTKDDTNFDTDYSYDQSKENNELSNTHDIEAQKTTYVNDIQIYYHYIRQSKYSGSASIMEVDKKDLFNRYQNNSHHQDLLFGDFDPTDYGFQISKIVKDDRVLLDIQIGDDLKRIYSFPSAAPEANEHGILHNIDEIQGKYYGKFGFGIIPKCTDECNPTFTWYKDGKVFKSGKFLYWINHDLNILDNVFNSKWSCTISCEKLSSMKSDSVDNNEHAKTSIISAYQNVSMPIIKRDQIQLTRTIIGAGAQGTVRKGIWLATNVAIKTIKLCTLNTKNLLREIELLDRIRHPNIIQVLGICLEANQFHIVMECLDSFSLSDIIFEQSTKEEFISTTEKKNQIGIQICQAITYLHSQENPIIHRDVKPDNILVSKECLVKLCDMSLSKFTQMCSTVRSTVGTKSLKGTPLYMAPELLLKKGEATVHSDMWALGCTLIEMYSEKFVWDLNDTDLKTSLEQQLTNEKVPDINVVPFQLTTIIKQCFDYEPKKRPHAIDIVNVDESIN
ncbi:uncharacterized protein LOC125500555 [Athalia rosae]|uniref:uncharacterized protein LOC125500555 n=1 Tax=Athalia rosae TaxID=37344 RepID=UPI00203400B0|nr:uncharacterized protein LOC125500555 [Athalia rosae]